MYNRSKAIEYARRWWNGRNSAYYDFEKLGGDCTNFISQCLLAGGYQMDRRKWGWYYENLNSRSYSWTGVNELYNYLTTNESENSPRAREVSIEDIGLGDIVQLDIYGTTFHHTCIVTKIGSPINLDNIFVTCHTYNALDRRLSSYNIRRIRFLQMY